MDQDDRDQRIRIRTLAEAVSEKGVPEDQPLEELSPEEIRRLLHELRVHRIELEMRNEELRKTQKELDESRERYIAWYDSAPAAYLTLNEKGAILAANLSAANLLGVERNHLAQTPFSRFLRHNDADALYLHLRQVFKTGEPQTQELKLTGSDGAEHYVQIRSVPVRRDGGQSRCRTIVIDITQRKKLEEEFDRLVSVPADIPVLHDAKIPAEHAQFRLHRAELFPILPIPACLILLIILTRLDIRTVFDPPWLLPILNASFLTILPFMVTYVATKGYVQRGTLTLLMFGAGSLALGLGASLAGFTLGWLGGGPNASVTVYNVSVLSTAVFYLMATVGALTGAYPRGEARHRKWHVIFAYIVVAASMALLTIATIRGFTPLFFIQGVGPTNLRQAVLGAATVLFVVSGALLAVQHYLIRSKFLYWYSLAVFLMATGLVCILSQGSVGSPIGWLGRSAQYLAGIYLLIAIIAASRELRSRETTLGTGIADLFRHQLELMVEARTSQLSLAIEKLSREIDERKQAERSLRHSEQTLRSLVDDNPESLFLMDTEGIVLAANEAVARRLGTTVQDFVGRSFYDFLPEDVAEHRREWAEHVIRSGKKTSFEDVRLGRTIENHLQPVLDQEGRVVSLAYLGIDVTNLRKAQDVQRRLATAIEQSAEAVLITDAEGVIEYANPATERITGFQKGEMIGNTARIFKSGKHDKAFYERLWKTIQAGEVWSGRITNRKKEGTLYHSDTTISPVRDFSGGITHFVSMSRDITEHLRLSELLLRAQKMEAVGTLAGGVAHDFNNILQVVLGYSELILAEQDEKDPFHADLVKINQAGHRGADLVKRLLAFSRKTEIKPRPLNLNVQIEQLEKMWTRTIPKMIRIELRLADELSRVNADPTQMDQILMNLALNAKDAMPDGGVLTIETTNVFLDEEYAQKHLGAKPGSYVLFSVSDTGHGMDQETLDRIFEPFYTTKEVGKGTGLGLAMVYGIISQHGGHVRCYSEPGHGTTFKIYFPAISVETEHVAGDKSEGKLPRGTETILLVDDEEFVRDLGKRELERSGYTVLTASNGKEALEVFKSEKDRIVLVLLDFIMPEMGGKQCLVELLKINPNIAVLIAGGFAVAGQTEEAMEMGARGFVSKPYDMKEMLKSIRDVLDSR
jgi:PAS domain S-box-containing protein